MKGFHRLPSQTSPGTVIITIFLLSCISVKMSSVYCSLIRNCSGKKKNKTIALIWTAWSLLWSLCWRMSMCVPPVVFSFFLSYPIFYVEMFCDNCGANWISTLRNLLVVPTSSPAVFFSLNRSFSISSSFVTLGFLSKANKYILVSVPSNVH